MTPVLNEKQKEEVASISKATAGVCVSELELQSEYWGTVLWSETTPHSPRKISVEA